MGSAVSAPLPTVPLTPLSGSQTPFGLHAIGRLGIDKVGPLHAAVRLILEWSRFTDISRDLRTFDLYYASNAANAEDIVITLVSDLHRSGYPYLLLTDAEREQWLKIVRGLVERYDGDSDYGCTIPGGKDCYKKGDRLYPSAALRSVIAARPVRTWQVENEWLWQIRNPDKSFASPDDLIKLLTAVRGAIKERQPDAKIVMGAFTGLVIAAFVDGDLQSISKLGDTDCTFRRVTKSDSLKTVDLTHGQEQQIAEWRSRFERIIKGVVPLVDAVDFHSYDNNPYELPAIVTWLRRQMDKQGVQKKPIWSLENAGPFDFFAVMNLPQPRDCTKTNYPGFYDAALHSADVVKRYAIGLSGGIQRIYYSSLSPTTEWSQNYQRLALLDVNGRKKPAYETYKLMTGELSGFTRVERIDDETYKFSFAKRKPVFVVWRAQKRGNETALKNVLGGAKAVRVTTIVTKDNQQPVSSVQSLAQGLMVLGPIPAFVEPQ
jgi:hypothetical protein